MIKLFSCLYRKAVVNRFNSELMCIAMQQQYVGTPLYISSRCLSKGLGFDHSFRSIKVQNAAIEDNINENEEVNDVANHLSTHQVWLNTEQFNGYSNTYLKQFMSYELNGDNVNETLAVEDCQDVNLHEWERKSPLAECLEMVHSLYGELAEELQELHDNPLHKEFHVKMQKIKDDREKIAHMLDEVYSSLHPTLKTIYDAFLVRRYYHLADWILYVEHKREELFNTLSPEIIESVLRKKSIAEGYMERLRKLGDIIRNEEPLAGLLTTNAAQNKSEDAAHNVLSEYSEKELAILRQKVRYFRKAANYGERYAHQDKGSV